MDIEIIKVGQDFLALNKPAGLAVYRPPKEAGASESTVVDWLLKHYPEVRGVGARSEQSLSGYTENRPGIVHRLDRGTSGVLVVARNQAAYEFLKRQFMERTVQKEYLALVWGALKEDGGVINAPLARSRRGGFRWRVAKPSDQNQREAQTEWQVDPAFAKSFGEARHNPPWTLLRLWPKTGRAHQLRVHLAHIGHPIAGDPVYAFKNQPKIDGLTRIFLHAAGLTLALPGEDQPRRLEAPLPEELKGVLTMLE